MVCGGSDIILFIDDMDIVMLVDIFMFFEDIGLPLFKDMSLLFDNMFLLILVKIEVFVV